MESDYDYDFEDDPPSDHSLEDLSQSPVPVKKADQGPKKGAQIEEDQYSDEYESEHDDYEDDFEQTLPPAPPTVTTVRAAETAKVKAVGSAKVATVVKPAPKRPVIKTEVKIKEPPKRPPSNESAATHKTSSSQWEAKLNALKTSPTKSTKYLETLQKENAELRGQLKSLNAKLNDLIEDTPKRRPAESLTNKSRAKSEQLKTAEKQIDICQQEYAVVKARLDQLMAPAYGQGLSAEISNKEDKIKQLGKAITAAMKQRRAREKELERLIVRQEAPDVVKQTNELTQELALYTEKVREAEREAVRSVKQREDLSKQEEVLSRRVEKLADIASHYQTDEHLEEARRLEEMKSQIDKFSKHVEIVQHSSESKASRLKAQETELKKVLESYSISKLALMKEMTQKQLKIEVLETDLQYEIEFCRQEGLDDLVSGPSFARAKESGSMPSRSFVHNKSYPLVQDQILEVDESLQESKSKDDTDLIFDFNKPEPLRLNIESKPKVFSTETSLPVQRTNLEPKMKTVETSTTTQADIQTEGVLKPQYTLEKPGKIEDKPKIEEPKPVSLTKPNFSFKTEPEKTPRVSALDAILHTQSEQPTPAQADVVGTISTRKSRVTGVTSSSATDDVYKPSLAVPSLEPPDQRDRSHLLGTVDTKSPNVSSGIQPTMSASTFQPISAFSPPQTLDTPKLSEADKGLTSGLSTGARNRSHLLGDQQPRADLFKPLPKEVLNKSPEGTGFAPLNPSLFSEPSSQSEHTKRDRSHLFKEEKPAFVPVTFPAFEKPASSSIFSDKRVKPAVDHVTSTQTKELARKAEQSVFCLDLEDKSEGNFNFEDIQAKLRPVAFEPKAVVNPQPSKPGAWDLQEENLL
jgi:hypothetical protein